MTTGTPAWSRPPFEPGNELATTHGAYSERRVAPLAAQIESQARALDTWPGYLNDPAYGPAVASWARAEAVCELMWAYLAEQDIEAAMTETTEQEGEENSHKGRTTRRATTHRRGSVLHELHRWEGMAAARRSRLGLDPLSRARLGKDVTSARVDMAQLLSAEREAADARDGGTP